jgi:hypothetical protein
MCFMKRVKLILIVFVLLVLQIGAYAQKKGIDSLRFADRQWELEKRAMVLHYMQLTEGEKSSFWPLFERYQAATQYLEMEYVYLLTRFAKGYHTLPEKQYDELLSQLLKNDMLQARIRRQFFRKFKKALSPMQASTFMHLDNTFRTMVRLEIQKDLPVMDGYVFTSSVKK